MERTQKRIILGTLWGVAFWLTPAIFPVHAEVVMRAMDSQLAPQGSEFMTADRFPESRFGRPPAKPDMGVGQTYAARQVESLEMRDEEVVRENFFGNRAPAGLEIGNAKAQHASQPMAPSSTLLPPNPMPALAPQNLLSPASALTRKGVQEVALIASDLGFFPKTVFVSKDVPVRMYVTGSSKNTLCIMMDSFQVRKQVRSQKIEEITFTPNVPGKYRFYCPVNGMEGNLIVREFATRVAEGE